MTLQEYLDSIHGKTVAVVGIGVSNTPLIRLLLREGIAVTACDKRTREQLGELAGELEQWADDVQIENFDVHPHAFMGWIPAAGVVAMLSVLFYWLTFRGVVHGAALAVIALLLTVLAVICFWVY